MVQVLHFSLTLREKIVLVDIIANMQHCNACTYKLIHIPNLLNFNECSPPPTASWPFSVARQEGINLHY